MVQHQMYATYCLPPIFFYNHKIFSSKIKNFKRRIERVQKMEMSRHSLSYAKAKSLSPPLFPAKTTSFARSSVDFLGYNCLPRKLQFSVRELRNIGAIRASNSEATAATNASARWLLEPVGDGDSRHIGYKIARPGAFEIASNVATVGRVPEKADIVIPVPTVSGVHARIQKTEVNLLITDLDSTNGTFINEKRLVPGVVYPASPGNLLTFGDTNLAIFRVYKLEKEELGNEAEEPESESEPEKETNTSVEATA